MFHVLADRRAPNGRSRSARAYGRIGRRIGRASAVSTMVCLLLVAPVSLAASASSCPASSKHCTAPTGYAMSGGGQASAEAIEGHSPSPAHVDPIAPDTSSASDHAAQGPTHDVPDPAGTPQIGTETSHGAKHSAGSTGSRHHHSVAGHGHHHAGSSAVREEDPSGGRSEPNASLAPTGPINVPVDRVQGVRSDGEQGARDDGITEILSRPSSRVRMPDGLNASRPIEQVTDVLRFPAVLLGVILLFMAFQQRADRRDHMLAHAPVGSRQETLEFR
jgi:hypothetical protein